MTDVSFSEDLDSYSDESILPELEEMGFQELSNTTHSSRKPWEIITQTNIQTHQELLMSYVSDVLACPRPSSRVLLIRYRWDKEAIIQDFVERGRNEVFSRAGCTHSESEMPLLEVSGMICECCYEMLTPTTCTRMSCGHYFCNDCWLGHLSVQIREGNSCRLKCMAFKCESTCDEDKVLELLKDQHDLKEQYQKALVESFVNDNKHVKWCPSIPNCGNAVKVEAGECCEPLCHCGLRFCFSCLSEAHSPCTCDMWAAWETKQVDESETNNWITANTKPCPSCGKSVEKNGGCNLMTCRCGQHFCWLCGVKTGVQHTYNTIANHQCGRWKEDMEKSISIASADHKRYMHYYTRWKQHNESLDKETKNREGAEKILMELSQDHEDDSFKSLCLKSIVDVLLTARRVLANSYPFAFFMCGNEWFSSKITSTQNGMNQILFEDLQQQLENEVEHLSKLLSETDDEEETSETTSKQTLILNSCRSIVRRMGNFYHAINHDLLGQLEESVCYIASFVPYGFQV